MWIFDFIFLFWLCLFPFFFFKNPTLFQTSQPSDQPQLNVFQCKSHGFSKVSPNCTESKEMHIYLFLSLNHHLESFSKVPTLILYRSVSTLVRTAILAREIQSGTTQAHSLSATHSQSICYLFYKLLMTENSFQLLLKVYKIQPH